MREFYLRSSTGVESKYFFNCEHSCNCDLSVSNSTLARADSTSNRTSLWTRK